MPIVVFGTVLGNLTFHQFAEFPSIVVWLCFIVLMLFLGLLARNLPLLRSFIVAFTVTFIYTAIIVASELAAQLPMTLEDQQLQVMGRVNSVPQVHERSISFNFAVSELLSAHFAWPQPGLIQVNWSQFPTNIRPGQRYLLSLNCLRPHGLYNPGGRDQQKMLFAKKIHAVCRVLSRQPNYYLSEHSLGQRFNQIRQNLFSDFSHFDPAFSGILAALAIGLTQSVTPEQWQIFFNTGTGHLLAISGLHVGLAASCGYYFIHFIWRLRPYWCLKVPATSVAAMVAMLTAVIYSALAGFALPTERAVLMISIFMLSRLLHRPLLTGHAFLFALLTLIILEPLSTLLAGFWLSFGAVGLLLYGLNGRLNTPKLWWKHGRPQWVMFMGMFPLSLILFGQLSLTSTLANLVAIPWIGCVVVPLTLLGTFCAYIHLHLLAFGFWRLADWCLQLIWPFLHYLGTLSWSVWSHPLATNDLFIFGLLGVLVILAPVGFPGRWLGCALVLPLFSYQPVSPRWGEVWLTLLDVGQGLAAVVVTQSHTLVFDTGLRFSEQLDSAQTVILPFLRSINVNRIDHLVVSHGDSDHSGGVHTLFKQIPIRYFSSSDLVKFKTLQPHLCHAGEHWTWDGVEFEFLTRQGPYESTNNQSCVLKVSRGKHAILFSGDIEAEAEQDLVADLGSALASTILVVPHHGSKTSSSAEFVATVGATMALYPLGYHNRFHFPDENVVKRYENGGAKSYTTADLGAIFVQFDALTITPPLGYRQQKPYYWH